MARCNIRLASIVSSSRYGIKTEYNAKGKTRHFIANQLWEVFKRGFSCHAAASAANIATTPACIKIYLLKTCSEEHLPYLVRTIFAQMEACSYLIKSSRHVVWSVYPVRRNAYVYSTGPESSNYIYQLRFASSGCRCSIN